MNNLKKKLFSRAITLVFIVSIGLWFSVQQLLTSPLNVDSDEMRYSISPGSSLSATIYDLANKKIIDHPRYIIWYARLTGRSNQMKSGDYLLTKTLTINEFLDNIFSGKVIQHSLTVIEGWSFKQLLQALQQHPDIMHTLATVSEHEIMTTLGLAENHPEGLFLPDTYHFPSQLTDVEFLQRAYQSLQTVLTTEWQNRAPGLIYKNPYEALIMASIVEKETGQASERQQIAGVFVRRLEKNMRLQTDPTVIYGMGDKYKGNIRKRDLLLDTPYNTYRRKGLPPTPIALPGQKAIHAALHPAAGNALYFVSRGDGSHVFSATLEEHNQAVIKYQLKGHVRSFSSYKHKNKE